MEGGKVHPRRGAMRCCNYPDAGSLMRDPTPESIRRKLLHAAEVNGSGSGTDSATTRSVLGAGSGALMRFRSALARWNDLIASRMVSPFDAPSSDARTALR